MDVKLFYYRFGNESHMKTILVKHSVEELYKAGFRGIAFVPVEENLDDIPDGLIAATLSWSKETVRTVKQNNSIYLYCKLLANKFNDAGLDMQAVLKKKKVSVSWTQSSVLEVIWRPIQIQMFNKKSTTKLSTKQVSEIYEVLCRHISQTFNISQSFPNRYGD